MTIMNMVGGGKSGPKVPLNDISTLSATSGDTEATLTWTDVGDLTVNGVLVNERTATKLVRKVGSAPSDSSDGTLVVTETVADTYSVNPYTDTGLTNGTTYYYKAFSVGSNGLESGSNSASVTPAQGGWQPGANTIAYYKIDDNDTNTTIYDHSGNSKNLTWAGTPTYQTDATYGRVAYFNGSSYASLGGYLNPNSTAYTWIAVYNGLFNKMILSQGSSSSRLCTIGLYSHGALVCQNPADANNYLDVASPLSENTWYMIAGVRDGNTFKIYVNGEYSNQKTYSSVSVDWTSGGYWELGANRDDYEKFTGKIKTVIFENKAWTDTEIANLAKEYGFNPS